MPTRLPERRVAPRNEPVPIKFLLAMFAVTSIAVVLSVAIVKDPDAPDAYANNGSSQTASLSAIDMAP
jgi:hypothetical protein